MSYEKLLRKILAHSSRSAGDAFGPSLAKKTTPVELARAIFQRDKKTAAQWLGVDEEYAGRLLWDLYKDDVFVELEGLMLEDWVDIVVLEDGRPLREHSPGELTSLGFRLMVTDRDCPLVFDYSESGLTPRALCKDLGALLLAAKAKRQIIFVTDTRELVEYVEADRVIVLDCKQERTPVAGPNSEVADDVARALGPTLREERERLRRERDQESWGEPWSPETDPDWKTPGEYDPE